VLSGKNLAEFFHSLREHGEQQGERKLPIDVEEFFPYPCGKNLAVNFE
jgi:hypothetical protein